MWVRLGEIKSSKKLELIRILPPVVPIRLLVRGGELYCRAASKPLKMPGDVASTIQGAFDFTSTDKLFLTKLFPRILWSVHPFNMGKSINPGIERKVSMILFDERVLFAKHPR